MHGDVGVGERNVDVDDVGKIIEDLDMDRCDLSEEFCAGLVFGII